MKKRLVRSAMLTQWASVLFLIILWACVTNGLHLVRPVILPGPKELWLAFIDMIPVLPKAIFASSLQIVSGFVIGSGLGIGLGLLMARSWLLYNIFDPIVNLIKPTPIFALIPLFILWFGVGVVPQIMLITFGCFVIMVISTAEAVLNVPSIYIQASLTLGANENQIFSRIITPAVVPQLIGSIRVAAASAFGLDVAAEFMGAQAGLGYLMIVNERFLRTEGVIVCIALFTLLAVFMDLVIRFVEKKLTPWTERQIEMSKQLRNKVIVRDQKEIKSHESGTY